MQPLWKSLRRVLKKTRIDLPQDTAIPLLGRVPRDYASYYRDICSGMFTVPSFTRTRKWEQPIYASTNEWIMKT